MTGPVPAAAARPASRGHLGLVSALAIMASNMIGTGVFTSLGFQVVSLHDGFALLTLWVLGGILSLTGALCYAELGAMLPESGGEFVYLGRAWSPWMGFIGGFISMTAGFAAPIALAGIAFGRYASAVMPWPPIVWSGLVLALVASIHWSTLHAARRFQVAITGTTAVIIVAFIALGLAIGPVQPISFAPSAASTGEILSTPFAISLIYVVYAYTGWNAIGYVAGEIIEPQRVIPRAVVLGVCLVGTLYVAIHWVFLRTVAIGDLANTVEVGALSASRIFGGVGGRAMSGVIALVLVGTISGFVLAGSRVTQAVFAATPRLAGIGARASNGVPRNALLVQFLLVVLLIATASFEKVLAYTGVVLNLTNLLAIAGLVRLRWTEPDLPRPFRTPWYPVTPIVFALLSGWMIVFVILQRPLVLVAAVVTLAIGAAFYRLAGGRRTTRHQPE